MSNLGGYQWLTTTAKKVGGPNNPYFVSSDLLKEISDYLPEKENVKEITEGKENEYN